MDKFLLEKKDILWLLFQESYIPAADRQGNNNPLQNGLLEFVQMLVRYLLFKSKGFTFWFVMSTIVSVRCFQTFI